MMKFTTLFIFCSLLILAESSSASPLWVTNPDGPYLCIHQTIYNKDGVNPLTEAYGTVNDSFDECPDFQAKNLNIVQIPRFQAPRVIYDPLILETIPGMQSILVDPMHDSHDPKLTSCRFGILY